MPTLAAGCLLAVATACGGNAGADYRIPREKAGDANLAPLIMTPMIEALEPDGSNEDQILSQATPGQRTVYLLFSVDAEVSNGGFAQFFSNSTGRLTARAIVAAAEIGAGEHERIIRAAAAVFPGDRVPEGDEERNRAFDALPESVDATWEALDDRWYALDGELQKRYREYIRSHPDEFFR